MADVTAKIATREGPIEVEARIVPTPGLVITREVHRENGVWKPKRTWHVTHEPTGYAVTTTPFDRLGDAVTLAARLGELADWTQSKDEMLAADYELPAKVREAIRLTEHDRLGEEIARMRKSFS